MVDLFLASQSPRRAEFLTQLGVSFAVRPADIDETPHVGEQPSDYVRRLALTKAEFVADLNGRATPVLGADTCVIVDDRILGKPAGRAQAIEMLGLLSNRWHEVHSGVAITGREAKVISVRTRVLFRCLEPSEAEIYWDTGEPLDKAGAYAIQGIGGALVQRVEGSFSNVVGLPLAGTVVLLRQFRIPCRWSSPG